MTYQPPPPPPGSAGQPAKFDPKSVNPLDWGIVGAGVLAFIFSFISFYTYSAKSAFGSGSTSESAWSGFLSLLAILLILVGAAAVAMVLFAPQVRLPFPPRLIGLGAFAVATVLLILALFVVPDLAGGGTGYDAAIDEGHGFGYWATLIMALAGTALSLMRFQATGGQLPGKAGSKVPNVGGYGPQGGIPGGRQNPTPGGQQNPPPPAGGPPPPPPGYGPPQ